MNKYVCVCVCAGPHPEGFVHAVILDLSAGGGLRSDCGEGCGASYQPARGPWHADDHPDSQ